MMIFLLIILRLNKLRIISFFQGFLADRRSLWQDQLFYLAYSLDEAYQDLLLTKALYLAYQFVFIMILFYQLALLKGWDPGLLSLAIFILLVFLLVSLSSRIAKNKSRLTEELGQFIFFYELYLIQGENQLQALNRASSRIGVFLGAESLEDHLDNFQRLFTYTKWLVVKRLAILIERAKHFSQEDLTMDFVEISDELFRKTYYDKKLQAEKIENLILLPMVGDLLAMIIYIVSPFIGSLIGG